MKRLLRETSAYKRLRADAAENDLSHAVLVLFPDEKLLRPLLRECAAVYFGAEDGGRVSRLIGEESFSDCVFFPAEGEKLTAESAARLLDESVLRPMEGTRKLFVLDGFQNVTPLVQNKLLKMFEEPAEGVCFLLGATAEHAVLPTVLSRMKKLTAPPFSEEQVQAALAREYAGEQGIAAAAAASGGIYSVAVDLLKGGGEDFALAARFLTEENFAACCREIGERKEKRAFLAALKLTLRDALFHATWQERYAALRKKEIEEIAREYPAGALIRAVSLTGEAERQIQFNANFGMALFTLALGIREEKEKWRKLSS